MFVYFELMKYHILIHQDIPVAERYTLILLFGKAGKFWLSVIATVGR